LPFKVTNLSSILAHSQSGTLKRENFRRYKIGKQWILNSQKVRQTIPLSPLRTTQAVKVSPNNLFSVQILIVGRHPACLVPFRFVYPQIPNSSHSPLQPDFGLGEPKIAWRLSPYQRMTVFMKLYKPLIKLPISIMPLFIQVYFMYFTAKTLFHLNHSLYRSCRSRKNLLFNR
jgi:hypothetical protein